MLRQIDDQSPSHACKNDHQNFESIEALLQSVSTLYEQRMQELLIRKLEFLQKVGLCRRSYIASLRIAPQNLDRDHE
jgi:hypothetical protein